MDQQAIRTRGRVCDVRQGPDGYIYVLTNERAGRLARLEVQPVDAAAP